MSSWVNEAEPFPAFLRTCSDMELVVLQHDARQAQDSVTLKAVLAELQRRAREVAPKATPEET